MKGIASLMENEVTKMTPEIVEDTDSQHLSVSVRQSLNSYFRNLEGQTPTNLYSLVLAEVEKPLIEMVLKLTKNNQSKAAIVLGISRGTLRKKMAIYGLLDHKGNVS